MKVLVVGASGYVGRHLCARLVADGRPVTAFVRSPQAAATAERAGARAWIGELDDAPAIQALARDHDAVVWAAQLMLVDERRVVSTLLEALRGGGRVFVFTSGTSLLSERTDGDWSENSYAEDDAFTPRRQIAPRLETENMVRAAAASGVRALCVRPPLVWGEGGSKVISDLYHSARATGSVCYVGRGLNVYSSVHVADLADLYSRALSDGVGGALYHCVSGEQNYRTLAEAIARHLGVGARGVEVEEAARIWDRFTGPIVFSSCSRTRSPRARRELGWRPDPGRLDILEDCLHPAYAAQGDRALPAWVARR